LLERFYGVGLLGGFLVSTVEFDANWRYPCRPTNPSAENFLHAVAKWLGRRTSGYLCSLRVHNDLRPPLVSRGTMTKAAAVRTPTVPRFRSIRVVSTQKRHCRWHKARCRAWLAGDGRNGRGFIRVLLFAGERVRPGPTWRRDSRRWLTLSIVSQHAHVREEEQPGGMFAEAKKSDVNLASLGAQLLARKKELQLEAQAA
jgi:hypothetical protein